MTAKGAADDKRSSVSCPTAQKHHCDQLEAEVGDEEPCMAELPRDVPHPQPVHHYPREAPRGIAFILLPTSVQSLAPH